MRLSKWLKIGIGISVYLGLLFFISYVERGHPDGSIKTFLDALWYSVITLTTIGYGDLYPVTPLGKVFSLTLVIGSIGVIGFFIGEISNYIRSYMDKKKKGLMGSDFSDHYVIIGWNQFGRMVAEQVTNANQKVAFVVDTMEDLDSINAMFDRDSVFVFLNESKHISDLNKVNIKTSKAVFVNLDDDSKSLVFVINLKKEFPNACITTTCSQPELRGTLLSVGVTNVVLQNEITSRMVASSLFEPHVAEYVNDLIATSVLEDDNDIQQYKVIDDNPYLGKSYIEAYIALKKDLNIILIGLVSDGKLMKNPADDYRIKSGDYLVIISYGDTSVFSNAFGVEEGV